MKLSNILLASMITSVVSISAQENRTKKDANPIKKDVKIESCTSSKSTTKLYHDLKSREDSIKIRQRIMRMKIAKRIADANRNYQNRCPGCGRG